MQKWTYFSMGVMAALILLLGGALLMQGREPAAYAAPQSVDNQGQFILATGSSEPNRYDMLWILHKHDPHPKLKLRGDEEGGILKGQQITLCLYKVERQGERMKLVAARDIAYDIELQDYNQENPTAKEVLETLKKRMRKD
ncbi:MAG TPA: hypothetical protein VFS19_01425 [Planctomycetota bacterium]|nr:hypothetical protein [Planctomycetota bacterium]